MSLLFFLATSFFYPLWSFGVLMNDDHGSERMDGIFLVLGKRRRSILG